MIPLPLLYGHWKAVVCHGASIWCWRCGVQRKVNEITSVCVAKRKFFWVHSFSTGIQYKSYTASHFAHTQGDKQEQKRGIALCFNDHI
jgi:hypothetical protein